MSKIKGKFIESGAIKSVHLDPSGIVLPILLDDLDVNGNRVLNLPAPILATEAARKSEVDAEALARASAVSALDTRITTLEGAGLEDVLEFANLAAFPVTGTSGTLYVDLAANKLYRWSGTVYVDVTQGVVVTKKKEKITLTSTHITQGYVDLLGLALDQSLELTPVGGPQQEELVDYTLSVVVAGKTRISFIGDLATTLEANDKLMINYEVSGS